MNKRKEKKEIKREIKKVSETLKRGTNKVSRNDACGQSKDMLEMVKLPRNIASPNVKLQYVLNSNANKFCC